MKVIKKLMILVAFIVVSTNMTENTFAEQIATSCVYNADGTEKVTGSGDTCAQAKDLATKIEGVVKTMTGLVGAFAVGMIVYGGFKYITSQGDPKAAEGAKNIIWYSGVGLFIVLLAFMIYKLLKSSIIS